MEEDQQTRNMLGTILIAVVVSVVGVILLISVLVIGVVLLVISNQHKEVKSMDHLQSVVPLELNSASVAGTTDTLMLSSDSSIRINTADPSPFPLPIFVPPPTSDPSLETASGFPMVSSLPMFAANQ